MHDACGQRAATAMKRAPWAAAHTRRRAGSTSERRGAGLENSATARRPRLRRHGEPHRRPDGRHHRRWRRQQDVCMEQLVVDAAVACIVRPEQPLQTVGAGRMALHRSRARTVQRRVVLQVRPARRNGRMHNGVQQTQPWRQHHEHEQAPACRTAAQQTGSIVEEGVAGVHRMRVAASRAAQGPILSERRRTTTATATVLAPAAGRSVLMPRLSGAE